VVAVRQWVAGALLLAVGRPRLRAFGLQHWVPVIGLALVFAVMNVSLYTAIDRVGLGLAVTLEFLGPLAVALVGARTATSAGPRRTLTTVCALLAGAGVIVLTRPQPTTDYVGVGLGVLAAVCWAGYILLNRTLGRRVPGVEGSAAAGALSALVYVPVGIGVLIMHPPTPSALGCALVAGVLSSVLPFLADLLALRRVPAHFFGIFMSLSPVFAAAIGAIFLGEALAPVDWLAIGLIVTANAVAVLVIPAAEPAARDDHHAGDRDERSGGLCVEPWRPADGDQQDLPPTRDHQLRQVALRDRAAEPPVDQGADAVEQAVAEVVGQREVGRVGEQQVAVGRRGVRDLPLVPVPHHRPEQRRLVQFEVRERHGMGSRQPHAGRGVGVEAQVAVLGRDEEGVRAARDVADRDDGERPARPQGSGGAGHPHVGRDPVERRRGHHRVDRLTGLVLERPDDHASVRERREVAPRQPRQRRTELDGRDVETAAGQLDGQLTGAAADLEHPAAAGHAGERDDVVDDRSRISGANGVVALGGPVERRPQAPELVVHRVTRSGREPPSGAAWASRRNRS
jgi:inner membrane transporter RhtA